MPGGHKASVALLRRTKAETSALIHDYVTEIYEIVDGSGTLITGGTLMDPKESDLTRLNAGMSHTGMHHGGESRKVKAEGRHHRPRRHGAPLQRAGRTDHLSRLSFRAEAVRNDPRVARRLHSSSSAKTSRVAGNLQASRSAKALAERAEISYSARLGGEGRHLAPRAGSVSRKNDAHRGCDLRSDRREAPRSAPFFA